MKYLKPIGYIVILLSCSYASLWYGFMKGYDFNQSNRLVDAISKVGNLNSIREGKVDEAISSIELQMDTNIIEWHFSDPNFINYIIGMPKNDPNIDSRFVQRIIKYKEANNSKCEINNEVCTAINEALYGNK